MFVRGAAPIAAALCSLLLSVYAHSASAQTSPTQPSTSDEPANPTPPAAHETESASKSVFSASWSLTYATRYLFQGLDYSDGKPVLEPELGIGAGPVGARLWVNHDLDQSVSNELDWSLYRDWSAGALSITTGYTYLQYPHRDGWDPSQEFYLDISRSGPLNPSVSVHYDVDSGTGTYWTFGLSHTVERPAVSLSFGTNLFYLNAYYGQTGIPSMQWSAGVGRSLRNLSLQASASRFFAWENGGFRDLNAVNSAWVFSLQVGQEF